MAKKKKIVAKVVINKNTSAEKSKKRKIKKKKYSRFRYTEEALKSCIEEVRNGRMNVNKAAAAYQIPRTTLMLKVKKNENTMGKPGPATILTEAEETMIETWIIEKARVGYPMPKLVKSAIQSVLKKSPRPNPFKNDLPGRKWFDLFLKRHPSIDLKHSEVLSKSRASVTEEAIKEWFHDLEEYLKSENCHDILTDPSRIYNMDETGVSLCPRTGKLLCEASEKNNYYISPGQDKENITVLGSYSADGQTIRPMILYAYKRMPPAAVCSSVPDGYVIGHSPNGYMTADSFSKFIENGFYPQLVANEVKFPVLVLFDGHSSHISMQLHDFCKDKGIILYLLYPNATHILQPCDVGIFKPLKKAWQQVVAEHSQSSTLSITKTNFAPLFHQAMSRASDPAVIKKAFQCCGLYPFNANAVNYSKCISSRRNAMKNHVLKNLSSNDSSPDTDETDSSNLANVIVIAKTNPPLDCAISSYRENAVAEVFEEKIPKDIISMFEEALRNDTMPQSETILFGLWKDIKLSSVKQLSLDCEGSNTDDFMCDEQNMIENDVAVQSQEDNLQNLYQPEPTNHLDKDLFINQSAIPVLQEVDRSIFDNDIIVEMSDVNYDPIENEEQIFSSLIPEPCVEVEKISSVEVPTFPVLSTRCDTLGINNGDTNIHSDSSLTCLELGSSLSRTPSINLENNVLLNDDSSAGFSNKTNSFSPLEDSGTGRSSLTTSTPLAIPLVNTETSLSNPTTVTVLESDVDTLKTEAKEKVESFSLESKTCDTKCDISPLDLSANNQKLSLIGSDENGKREVVSTVSENDFEKKCNNQLIDVKKEMISPSELKDLWKKELHFPEIAKSKKKKRVEKPKIFAITSEKYKQEEERKKEEKIEAEKLKELKKFRMDVMKKIKQEESEKKKEEKRQLQEFKKLQEKIKKEETEAKFEKLLKEKAESLQLSGINPSDLFIPSKKRKVLKDIN